jgi:hypothetical protein
MCGLRAHSTIKEDPGNNRKTQFRFAPAFCLGKCQKRKEAIIMNIKPNILSLFFIIFLLNLPVFADDWEFVHEKEGVRISRKHDKRLNIFEVKAETIIDAEIEVIGEVLMDIDAYPEWDTGCSEIKVLKRVSENEVYVYYVAKGFLTISDRDVIIYSKVEKDYEKGLFEITSRAAKEHIVPLRKGYVRIEEFREKWRLERIGAQKTKLTVTSLVNPGGKISKWLVNIAAASSFQEPLVKLKELVAPHAP